MKARMNTKNSETKPQYKYPKIDLNAEEQACTQVIELLITNGAERQQEHGRLEEFLSWDDQELLTVCCIDLMNQSPRVFFFLLG
jgi:hypothetical protein